MTAPRFFTPDLTPASLTVTLSESEAHHLTHVLRLGAGAEVVVFDGRGGEWAGKVVADRTREIRVDSLRALTPVAEPPVRVTLAVGVLKGDQMDAIVRDATMLGVAAIVPMITTHVVVSKKALRADVADRWQRVAVASAKQCRRAVVPAIEATASFAELLARPDAGLTVMCVEPTRSASLRLDAPRPATALVLVGPEGGWSLEEIEAGVRANASLIHLGPRTLRAETTPTVALSSLWTQWGW